MKSIHLKLLLLFGLFLRILLMPFTIHTDLINVYHRSYMAMNGDIQFHHARITAAIQFVHDIWFRIIHLILGDPVCSFLGEFPPQMSLPFSALSNNILSYEGIFSFLILAKLPYFLAELGCIYLLARFFKLRKGLLYWVYNPVILIAAYILGRYDVLIALFVLISLIALGRKKNRLMWAFLYISVVLRPPLLFFLFPFFLFTYKDNRQFFSMCALPVIGISSMMIPRYAPYLIPFSVVAAYGISHLQIELLEKIRGWMSNRVIQILSGLAICIFIGRKHREIFSFLGGFNKLDYMLNLQFSGGFDRIYLIIPYFLTLFMYYRSHPLPFNVKKVHFMLFINTLILFLLSYLHIQYFLWGLPLLFLFNYKKLKLDTVWLVSFFLLGMGLYLLHWDNQLLIKPFLLFSPDKILSMPLFSETYGNALVLKLCSIGKSVLAALSLFIAGSACFIEHNSNVEKYEEKSI